MPTNSRPTTKSEIHKDLIRKITTDELQLGQRLTEAELVRIYGVSRTPIRDVLLSLEKEGSIERRHNHGAGVMPFTVDDIEHISHIRKALDPDFRFEGCLPTL